MLLAGVVALPTPALTNPATTSIDLYQPAVTASHQSALLKKVAVISSPGLPKDEFLEHKRKMKWFEMDAKNNCVFIYPWALCITWVRVCDHLPENCPWDGKYFKETSEEHIEVAKLPIKALLRSLRMKLLIITTQEPWVLN